MRLIKPLTAKERVIVLSVCEGHRGQDLLDALAGRGYHLAASTLETRIRDIAGKCDNPHGLPPRSVIRLLAESVAA